MNVTQLQGRLDRWDENKGFGFIQSDNNLKGIFIHISAFKRDISRRPIVGDVIFYELYTDADGKNKAVNARIEGVSAAINNPRRNRGSKKTSSTLSTVISLIFLLGFAIFAINKSQTTHETKYSIPALIENSVSTPTPVIQTQYSCQGKTSCPQMSSCEEAQFYQNNCSGTKMDGDGDGIPCEDQWCGH
jgi:cold shock CspA family protein